MDPSLLCSPATIISALKAVHLWTAITLASTDTNTNPTDEGLLSTTLAALPPLTPGQVHLFSLARAILRTYTHPESRPIVLLDEPTASLDASSEQTFYELLDEHFTLKGYTVLMITHKLDAARKYLRGGDLVVELASGEIVKEELIEV